MLSQGIMARQSLEVHRQVIIFGTGGSPHGVGKSSLPDFVRNRGSMRISNLSYSVEQSRHRNVSFVAVAYS